LSNKNITTRVIADKLIKAAKDSQNPMMKSHKGEEELKEAAKDLGLK